MKRLSFTLSIAIGAVFLVLIKPDFVRAEQSHIYPLNFFSQFIGVYGTFNSDGRELALNSILNSKDFIIHGINNYRTFDYIKVPLDLKSHSAPYSDSYFSRAVETFEYFIEGKSLVVIRTVEGRFKKHVYQQTISMMGPLLNIDTVKEIYVRKFLISKTWVLEKLETGKPNIHTALEMFARVSSTPISAQRMYDHYNESERQKERMVETAPNVTLLHERRSGMYRYRASSASAEEGSDNVVSFADYRRSRCSVFLN